MSERILQQLKKSSNTTKLGGIINGKEWLGKTDCEKIPSVTKIEVN
jgi:hypothetical protein